MALVVALLAMLPLLYLALRALDADNFALDYLLSENGLAVTARSLVLMLVVMGGAATIGIPFAWITSRTDLPLRRLWLALGLVPMVTPTYLIAITFVSAFGQRGLLQKFLEPLLGIQRLPPIYGLFGSALVLSLCTFPFVALPLRAAFMQLTPLLEEAASDLGANRWQAFWRVILPQCRPALFSGMTLAGLYSLGDFGAAAVMRYDNFTHVIYLQYTSSFDRNRGAAFALMLGLITLLLVILERRSARKIDQLTVGTPDTARLVRLGGWRYPAILFSSVIVGLGAITPFAVLLHWLTTRTVSRSVDYSPLLLTLNTFGVSAVTAVVGTLIAIPLVALMRRSPAGWLSWLGRLSYIGYILPGIVVGLALVFFTNRYLPTLYQTFPILIIAYVLRFLPIVVSATYTAFAQVNPRLEETAHALGAVRWQVMARVTLPLSRAGIMGGMILLFLAAMKELPIALMLAPTGFHTLSYRIWSAYQEAIFSQIGLPGLLLMVTSTLSITLILNNESVEALPIDRASQGEQGREWRQVQEQL